jgi:hypothetical protein
MNDITVIELRKICKSKGLKGYSYLNKADLIKLLEQNGGQRFQTSKRVFKKINKELKKSYVSVFKKINTKISVINFLKKNKIKDNAEIILVLKNNVYKFTLDEFLKLKQKNKQEFYITLLHLTKRKLLRIYAK